MDVPTAAVASIPTVVLSSGYNMPLIGAGTIATPLPDPQTLTTAFIEAIKLGYRHFDTSAIYGSEESLGRAISEAHKQNLVTSRQDLFITTKLWCDNAAPHLVLRGLQESLR